MAITQQLRSLSVGVSGSLADRQDCLWRQGWTDGIPVLSPTRGAVRQVLAAGEGRPADGPRLRLRNCGATDRRLTRGNPA